MEPTPKHCRTFSPPWDLMCLKAYLSERTRHAGHLLDCRLYAALERELVEAISSVPGPRLAAVQTETTNLGQAAAILEIVKRHFPNTATAVMGPHPSQFPEHALLPRADFAIAGDAEPTLRNLLDCLGREQRLFRIPGLIFDRRDDHTPYWLPNLKGLSVPEWETFFWRGYQLASPDGFSRVAMRLSRGHTRLPADRAFGGAREPLRFWPLERLAKNLQRCAIPGINEVFVADPPGFWTVGRLRDWCAALKRVRNMQPWSLQLLPAIANEEIISTLYEARCTRVQFVVPSCEPDAIARYGCNVSEHDLAGTVALLKRFGIRAHTRFWLGGPEEVGGEEARILRYLRVLGYDSFSLAPFPFFLDAPLYEETADRKDAPSPTDWMQWAWDPWNLQRPLPFWGGEEAAHDVRRTMTRIRHRAKRSPKRLAQRAVNRLLGQKLDSRPGRQGRWSHAATAATRVLGFIQDDECSHECSRRAKDAGSRSRIFMAAE